MKPDDELLQSQLQEIRRGSVVIATLALAHEPQYGYALVEHLDSIGIGADANTLYPLLRRMEKQGLLESVWNTDEARPRKYYRTTPAGEVMRVALLDDWNRLTAVLNNVNGAAE